MDCIKKLLCAVVVTGLGFSAADGKEMMLEDMLMMEIPSVITASLTEQTLDKVPGSITVITEKQIKLLGLNTLLDVFNIVPGFQTWVPTHGTMNVSVRGRSDANANIKLMIDGYSVNNGYDHAFDAHIRYPLDNVKQIEIIRGPGSCLYGTDAFSAVVNIITKKEKRTEVSLSGGMWNNRGINAAYSSDPDKDFSCSAAVNYSSEDGDNLTYERDYLTGFYNMSAAPITHNKGKRRLGADLFFKYKQFSLAVNHADNRLDWTEQYMNIQSPGDEYVLSKYDFADLQYLHKFSDSTSLLVRGTYDLNSMNYIGQFTPAGFSFGGPMAVGYLGLNTIYSALLGKYISWDAGSGKYYVDTNADGIPEYWPDGSTYNGYILSEKSGLESVFRTKADKHELILGLQYRRDAVKEVKASGTINMVYLTKRADTTVTGNDLDNWMSGEGTKEDITAGFVQDIYEFSDKLSLIAGFRYDMYELAGNALSPRVAVIWNAFGEHTVKLSYGQAFFAPLATQRYLRANGYIGNPNLKPQTVQTYEVSLQNSQRNKLNYGITLFYSMVRDGISYVVAAPGLPNYANSGRWSYKGAELEGKWRVSGRLDLWGNYTYQEYNDEVNNVVGDGISNLGNIGATAQVNKKLSFSTYAHISGVTKTYYMHEVAGWVTTNAALVYSMDSGVNLSLTASNLFDTKYYSTNLVPNIFWQFTSSDYPFEGRQVLVKATCKF